MYLSGLHRAKEEINNGRNIQKRFYIIFQFGNRLHNYGCIFFFSGLYFYTTCLYTKTSDMYYVFQSMFLVIMFVIPLFTMKLFSEERKQKTDQALLTSPISITRIVIGKYFSAIAMFAICLLIFVVFEIILAFIATPSVGVIFGNILGLLLLGSSLISIGIFVSSLTESQAVAALVTFAIEFVINILDSFASTVSNDFLKNLLLAFSFRTRYNNFALGLINLADMIFYLSVTALFLFLTIRVIDKRRWS